MAKLLLYDRYIPGKSYIDDIIAMHPDNYIFDPNEIDRNKVIIVPDTWEDLNAQSNILRPKRKIIYQDIDDYKWYDPENFWEIYLKKTDFSLSYFPPRKVVWENGFQWNELVIEPRCSMRWEDKALADNTNRWVSNLTTIISIEAVKISKAVINR